MKKHTLKVNIRNLYDGTSVASHNFRYTLLLLDLLTIIYLVISTFFTGTYFIHLLDFVFGFYLAVDYFARLWVSGKRTSFILHPLNIADLIATVSFLAPLLGGNFSFLRGIRVLRLLRSYRFLAKLRHDFAYFKKNEDIIISASNLFVFIFIMTEIVFVTQVGLNPHVTNFLDAMYFTIATLTTTGFGDVILEGQTGHLLSIIIMIFGVSLFLRLVQTIFRPAKARYTCKSCGLFLHDCDAVHCKHCGAIINIPSEGAN